MKEKVDMLHFPSKKPSTLQSAQNDEVLCLNDTSTESSRIIKENMKNLMKIFILNARFCLLSMTIVRAFDRFLWPEILTTIRQQR